MILSKKEFEFESLKKRVFFDGEKCFVLMDNNVRNEIVAKAMLDEKGNEMFNEGENNEKIPVKHFVETKMCFPYFAAVIVDESVLKTIQKSHEKIENIDDFLTPYEVK